MNQTTEQRFWEKVEKTSSCWNWTAYITIAGYGRFGIKSGQMIYAHRFSYELHKGKIPKGFQIDHLCRNHKCVNPDHLEAVTPKENIKRGETGIKTGLLAKSKTHCPKGHPYDESNTYITPVGGRNCRICRRFQDTEYRKKQKFLKN